MMLKTLLNISGDYYETIYSTARGYSASSTQTISGYISIDLLGCPANPCPLPLYLCVYYVGYVARRKRIRHVSMEYVGSFVCVVTVLIPPANLEHL